MDIAQGYLLPAIRSPIIAGEYEDTKGTLIS